MSTPPVIPRAEAAAAGAVDPRLGLFVEHAPAAIAMLDRELRYVAVSRRWLQDYGIPDADVIGRSHYEVFPEIPDRWREIHRRCLAGAVEKAEDDPFPRADGTTDWVSWEIHPWRDAGGAVGGILLFTEVVTARKRVELALRESEARLKAVVGSLREGLVICGMDGRFLFWNDAALEMHGLGDAVEGLAPLEHLAARFELRDRTGEVVPPERWPIARVLAGEVLHAEELVVRHRDSGWDRVFQYGGRLVRDERGAPNAAVVTTVDVTARRRSERALRDSEQRFRALVEQSNDVTFLLDAQACLTFVTPRTAGVLGHPAEALLGRPLFDFVEPEDAALGRERLPALLAEAGAVARQSYRVRGGPIVELTARNLLHDPVIGAIVVNGRDVTEQRRLEEQVLQSQKLESVGRLAGGIAHDFNNLLTVILSCAEALGEDVAAGRTAAREDVEEIAGAAARAAELTRQLLAFARRQVIAPRPVDLNAAVRSARRMLERLVGEDVLLVERLAPDVWPVRCDPVQLEQVLLNVVVNARDAMPTGGTITLETANAPVDAVPGGALPAGDFVRLSISDTGHGMSPEVQAHVFEPFFTTKPKGAGTGLGLATVYGIVKQAGGDVAVRSAPGRGTTLELLFPREAAPRAQGAPAAPAPRARGSEAILLVEDDPGVRDVTARALRAGGYRVIAAEGGRRALDLVARGECRPALLVTDVVMPAMDGPTLAAALRASDPGLRVLYVSGYSHDALGRHGELSAGVELLAKPFTSDALLARVRALLDAP